MLCYPYLMPRWPRSTTISVIRPLPLARVKALASSRRLVPLLQRDVESCRGVCCCHSLPVMFLRCSYSAVTGYFSDDVVVPCPCVNGIFFPGAWW